MPREPRRFCALIVVMVSLCGADEAKHMALVVNKTNPQTEITTADLVKVFKFDSRKWPDGRNVTVVLLDPSMPDMRTALEKLYHMRPDELRVLLASHPAGVVVVKSDEELLKSVESIPGAVGLVDVFSINSHVNVLKVDGKLPLEQGYLLR